MLLVAPRVFRAPEGPAAREARRPHFVRRVGSLSGQAPPPPTGTAARPSDAQGRRCQNSQPRSSLFLSGVTPLSRVLHHFPGSVMLPKWCNAP